MAETSPETASHHSQQLSACERLTWPRNTAPVRIMHITLQFMWQAQSNFCPCGGRTLRESVAAVEEVSLHERRPWACCLCCESSSRSATAARKLSPNNESDMLMGGSVSQCPITASPTASDSEGNSLGKRPHATVQNPCSRSTDTPGTSKQDNVPRGVADTTGECGHTRTAAVWAGAGPPVAISAASTGSPVAPDSACNLHPRTIRMLPRVAQRCCAPCGALPGIAAYVIAASAAASVLATLQSITSVTLHNTGSAPQENSVDTSVPYAVNVGISDVCRLALQLAVLALLYGQTPLPLASLLAHCLWLHLKALSPKRAQRAHSIVRYTSAFLIFGWIILLGVLAEQALRAVDPSFSESISYKAYGNSDAPAYGLEIFFLVFCFIPSNLGLMSAVWLLVCCALLSREAFCALQDAVEPPSAPQGEDTNAAPVAAVAETVAPRDTEALLQAMDIVHASVSRAVRLLASCLSACLGWLLLLAGLGWVSALASIIVTATEAGQLNSAGVIATLVTVAVSICAILVLLAGGAAVTFAADLVHQNTAALLCAAPPLQETADLEAGAAAYLRQSALRAHVLSAMQARRPGWYLFQRRIQMSTVVSVVSVLAAIASLSLQQLATSI